MPVTRLRGSSLRVFRLNVSSGGPSANFDEELISANLTDGEGENLTFADFANGEASKAIEAELVYSGDTGSAYDFLWKNAGKQATFIFSLHGVSTAAAGKPVYTGTLTLPPKPNVENEAGTDFVRFSATFQIDSITRATV